MTAACFVDANVLVYSCDKSDLRKRTVAAALIDRLWREQSGRTSIQALNEFYTVVTSKAAFNVSHDEAWHVVEELLEWTPRALDGVLLQQARAIETRHRLNWWDCLIVAAAQLQDCSILYTEDLHHGAVFGSVRVSNPFITQVQDSPPVPYSAKRASPHRPRGRPRKVA
jgi:predicted nucleic acid-binding protein